MFKVLRKQQQNKTECLCSFSLCQGQCQAFNKTTTFINLLGQELCEASLSNSIFLTSHFKFRQMQIFVSIDLPGREGDSIESVLPIRKKKMSACLKLWFIFFFPSPPSPLHYLLVQRLFLAVGKQRLLITMLSPSLQMWPSVSVKTTSLLLHREEILLGFGAWKDECLPGISVVSHLLSQERQRKSVIE